MLSPRRLLEEAYRGNWTGRIPFGIYSRYLKRGARERGWRASGLGIIDYAPVASFASPPWHQYDEFLSPVEGADLSIRKYWENGILIERRIFDTPRGSVYQETAKDGGGTGSEHIRRHFVRTKEDYGILRYLAEKSVILDRSASVVERQDELGEDGVVLARLDRTPYQKCLIELAGPERFLMDFHDDPEPILELMRALERKSDDAFFRTLDSAVEFIWQPDNVTVDMTPPSAFGSYLCPLYARRASLAEQAGKRYLVHMDGRLKALAGLIAASGIHAVESFTLPAMGGDLTLREARALFPVAIPHPNVPSNWALLGQGELEAALEGLVDELKGTPSILQVSEDIPPEGLPRVLDTMAKVLAGTAARW